MTYAVVDFGGNQMIIEPGKFYDINYISATRKCNSLVLTLSFML